MNSLSTWPFAEPKMAVLYATFSGILLATGMEFFLRLFSDDEIEPWRASHLAGVLFIAASLSSSVAAGIMQFFHAHLARVGKENAALEEKSIQFASWKGNWWVRALSLLALAALISAVGVLAYVAARPPHPAEGGDCNG